MNAVRLLISVSFVVSLAGCTSRMSLEARQQYMGEVAEWRADRYRKLRQPDGWPTLVGLYWLQEGENPVGSARGNKIHFPSPMPLQLGRFLLNDDTVSYRFREDVAVTSDGVHVTSGRFHTDQEDSTTYLSWRSYQWHIIQRGDRFGVRLRDTLHPARMSLKQIPAYPVRPYWRKEATFVSAEPGKRIALENKAEITQSQLVNGYLEFRHRGKEYRLIALDGGKDTLFVIIADRTTGLETYGGGRYLYVPKPLPGSKRTWIDFNKAQNPPCVFTDYATCPLPPQENILPFHIRAGEKHVVAD